MSFGSIDDNYMNLDFEEISYLINLSGVTWENRQTIIGELNPKMEVYLERDYQNKYDKNAIAVKIKNGQQIGWIPKHLAETLAPELDADINWRAKIEGVVGGEEVYKGVTIKLFLSRNDMI